MRNAIDEVENDMQPITDANGKMDFAQPIVGYLAFDDKFSANSVYRSSST